MKDDMILFMLGSLGRLVRRAGDRSMRSIGLSSAQLRILACIADNGRPQKDIERGFSMSRATVSSLVDSMEEMGLLQRERMPGDGRMRRIVITDSGREKLRAAGEQMEKIEEALAAALPEKDEFMDTCMRLRSVLEEMVC